MYCSFICNTEKLAGQRSFFVHRIMLSFGFKAFEEYKQLCMYVRMYVYMYICILIATDFFASNALKRLEELSVHG